MSDLKPWEYHPDLTRERLVTVARLLEKGRNDALDWHNPAIGANGWTLGCNAFAYQMHQLLQAIDSGEYDWLTAMDRSLHFVFRIGEVPVRFYRGEAEKPTDRTMHQSHSELRQLELIFDVTDKGKDLAYRFAVETDIDGTIMRIIFVGLQDESAVLYWEVPFGAVGATVYEIGRKPAEGVDLQPPQVGLPEDEDKDEDDQSGVA